jgi:hypothetical protein
MTASNPYGSHQYWRVTLTNPINFNYYCAGFQLFEDPQYWVPISYTGATIVASDGTDTTNLKQTSNALWWISSYGGGGPISLTFHFPAAHGVVGFGWQAPGNDDYWNRYAKTLLFEYSDDGATWHTAWNIADLSTLNRYDYYANSGPMEWGHFSYFYSPDYVTSQTDAHAYWRMRWTGPFTDHYICLEGTTEFRPDIGAINQTHFGTSIASGYYGGGYEIAQAFSGQTGRHWASPNATDNAWLGYHFPMPVILNELKVQCRNGDEGPIHDMYIEYSDDGVTWSSDTWVQTALPAWTSNEVRLWPNPNLTPTIIEENNGLFAYAFATGNPNANASELIGYAMSSGVSGAADASQLVFYSIQRYARSVLNLKNVIPLNCWQPCTPFAIFEKKGD